MPLTTKGKKTLAAMQKTYGKKRGEQVFYASINSGRLKKSEMEKSYRRNPVKGMGGYIGPLTVHLHKSKDDKKTNVLVNLSRDNNLNTVSRQLMKETIPTRDISKVMKRVREHKKRYGNKVHIFRSREGSEKKEWYDNI